MAMPIMQTQTIFRNGKRFVPVVYYINLKIKLGTNAPRVNVVTLISSPIATEVRDAIHAKQNELLGSGTHYAIDDSEIFDTPRSLALLT